MSEFIWNVEEQKLRELSKEEILDKYIRSDVYSLQEMQDAMDKYGDTPKWSNIWEKFELFQKEKDTIKKDKYGHYNTNSLNAWCKKNGAPQKGYNTSPGSYSMGYYCNINITWETRERIENLIPNLFYQFLEKLQARENNWFRNHDEYTIKCRMIEENIYNRHLPVPFEEDIHFNAFFDGWIYKYHPDQKRKLTIEELDKIIIFQNAVANAIKNVIDTQSPRIEI